MERLEAEKKLKDIFGIDHFYEEQWNAISKILKGERILMIERTGFGKSLCYQFPATQFSGITIIFSPLIALMRDQVSSLENRGIKAAFINSEQSDEENEKVIKSALEHKIKILYIAPERQENDDWITAVRNMDISMVVIDEAHTISTWGHDFRPSFRRIINLVNLLPKNLPVLATTATATKRVQEDIEKQIGGTLTTIRGSLNRNNLRLKVVRVNSEEEKMLWLAENLKTLDGTGLIYTGKRVDTDVYAKWLNYVGISAIGYNAGLERDSRVGIEKGLMSNEWKCIVSTNALGMGIDKKDIRFIIHTQIPQSPIHYYQEIGRAGRDGQLSTIILFFNEAISYDGLPADVRLPKSFIENGRPKASSYHNVIEILKNEPCTERSLQIKANLKQTQVRVIKADLIDQGIVKLVSYGKSKMLEYQHNAPQLSFEKFEALRQMKLKELDSMVGYIYTSEPRMKYLCNFLDSDDDVYSNCDNTNLAKEKLCDNPMLIEKLNEFRDTYFPVLDVSDSLSKTIDGEKLLLKIIKPGVVAAFRGNQLIGEYHGHIKFSDFSENEQANLPKMIEKLMGKSRIIDGVAGSYYGATNVGNVIHKCKYQNGGDFPDMLLKLMLRAFVKNFDKSKFDLVLYVPPTVSGDLVKNIAYKFAATLDIPISDGLVKIRETKEQKIFESRYGKSDNAKDAFSIDADIVKDKSVILIDDIYDSGATIKEIGAMLTTKGVKYVVPVVIAKTVGGTL